MKMLKTFILPLVVIVCYIFLLTTNISLTDIEIVLPTIFLVLYYFLIIVYNSIYHKNLNRKLRGEKSYKLPELRVVTSYILGLFITIIIFYTSWYVLPILSYKNEIYIFSINENISQVSFEDLSDMIYDEMEADEIIIYDVPNLGINPDKTIKYFNFMIIVTRDNNEKFFHAYYEDGELQIRNTYYTGDPLYSYNQGDLNKDLVYYDLFDIDYIINSLDISDNYNIYITPQVSAYGTFQNIGVRPHENEEIYLIDTLGNKTEVVEYSEFNESLYYVITIVYYDTTSQDSVKKITHVYERVK